MYIDTYMYTHVSIMYTAAEEENAVRQAKPKRNAQTKTKTKIGRNPT